MSESPNAEQGTRKAPPPESLTPGLTGAWGTGPSLSSATPTGLGRFEVRQILGEGTFGRVYLAFDSELGRQVAIKVPRREGFTAEMRERFIDEARVVAGIDHPNVCPVYDVGAEGDLPYIVMRYVVGGTLAERLDRLAEPLPPRQALAIARKLALGTAAAHARGIVHRDLKPGNVLYDGANDEVLITDFGLAKLIAADASVSIKGTPLYMPPEQWQPDGPHKVGPLSDVYSLGVILYRLLTGAAPFTGSTYEMMFQHLESAPRPPSTVRPSLDPRLDAIVLRAMAKNPAERFPTAQALAEEIAKHLDAPEQSGAVVTPVFAWSDAPPPRARRPVTRWVLAAVVFLAGIATVWWGVSRPDRPSHTAEQTPGPDDRTEAESPKRSEPVPELRPVTEPKAPEPKPKEPEPKEVKIDPNKLLGKWERSGAPEAPRAPGWEFKAEDGRIVGVWSLRGDGPRFRVEGDKLHYESPGTSKFQPPPGARTSFTIIQMTDDTLEIKLPSDTLLRYKKVK